MPEEPFEPYSMRKKRAKGTMPSILSFDNIPSDCRIGILHILDDIQRDVSRKTRDFRPRHGISSVSFLARACYHLRRLLDFEQLPFPRPAAFCIPAAESEQLEEEVREFLKSCDVDRFLDAIEYILLLANDAVREDCATQDVVNSVVVGINRKFSQYGVGYTFESGSMIQVSNELTYHTVVEPTIHLLREPGFDGANDEFLKSHEHLRHGRFSEALVEALKAFESAMKVICDYHGWAYESNQGAKHLIGVCIKNSLLPAFSQEQLNNVAKVLESGVPTMRNKQAGHGSGSSVRIVPKHFAEFGINAAAAAILLLVNSHKALNAPDSQ